MGLREKYDHSRKRPDGDTPPPVGSRPKAKSEAKPAENVPNMTYSRVLQRIQGCKKIKNQVSTDFQNLAKNRLWLKGAAKAMFSEFGAISNATALDPFARKMFNLKIKHVTTWLNVAWKRTKSELQQKASTLMKWGSTNKMDINKYEVYVRGWLLALALPQKEKVRGAERLQPSHFAALDAGSPFDYNKLHG